MLGSGQVGMMILGDFAAPLLTDAGYKKARTGRPWASRRRPSETFLMVIDTFTRPKGRCSIPTPPPIG
jgi:hypothetical protein